MAENKTKPNEVSVEEFLAKVEGDDRRADCEALVKLMRGVTRKEPQMWGPSIVGFGHYRYRYESGREGDWFLCGFSPRKRDLTLYIMSGFSKQGALMKQLGKHKTGKSCLYIKSLADVDKKVLRELVKESVAYVKKQSVA